MFYTVGGMPQRCLRPSHQHVLNVLISNARNLLLFVGIREASIVLGKCWYY